ncbi:hypothetical protein LLH00_07965 [bacterium]|nr:hypothetical protein [bacterium]
MHPDRRFLKLLLPLLSALCFLAPSPRPLAAAAGRPVHPLYDERLDRAAHLVLQMKLDPADSLIEAWIAENPKRPVGYFFSGVSQAWRLFLQPEGADLEPLKKRLAATLSRCSLLSQKTQGRGEYGALEGSLYAGASCGLEAMLAMLDGRYLVMAPLAHQAWGHIQQAVVADPLFYDSYMSVGIYQYFTGRLPEVMRLMAVSCGFEGDCRKGLDNLRLAAARGLYSGDEARIVLMNIYAIYDEPLDEGVLEMARGMFERYPDNPLVQVRYGDLLLKAERFDQAEAVFGGIERKISAGAPFYDNRIFSAEAVAYRLALSEKGLGRDGQALERLRAILSLGDAVSPEWIVPASHLECGELYLRAGDLESAGRELKMASSGNHRKSQKRARELLDRLAAQSRQGELSNLAPSGAAR